MSIPVVVFHLSHDEEVGPNDLQPIDPIKAALARCALSPQINSGELISSTVSRSEFRLLRDTLHRWRNPDRLSLRHPSLQYGCY